MIIPTRQQGRHGQEVVTVDEAIWSVRIDGLFPELAEEIFCRRIFVRNHELTRLQRNAVTTLEVFKHLGGSSLAVRNDTRQLFQQ